MNLILEPHQKISQKAIQVYRTTSIITELITLIILGGFIYASYLLGWAQWIKVTLWLILGITPFLAIWATLIYPNILQKYWRYGIDGNFVRLKYGKFFETDIVVPMTKIQYVEIEQGPILRRFQLNSLTIGTLRSAHKIPALPMDEALKLRDLIAHHANINEVDDLQ